MTGTRAWHLKSRPSGMPDMGDFELKEMDLPPLGRRLSREIVRMFDGFTASSRTTMAERATFSSRVALNEATANP